MKKEVLLAIIIGLIFGLIITFGAYQANRYAKPNQKSTQDNITPTPSPNQENTLFSLISPTEGDILNDSIATISGTIKSGATLVVITEDDEIFVKQKDESFNQTITLSPGANLIRLIAVNNDGVRQELNLNLVYSTTKLDDTNEK